MSAFSDGFIAALRSGIWLSRETAVKNWENGKAVAKLAGKDELETAIGLAEASYYQGFIDALAWLLHGDRVSELNEAAGSIEDANIIPPYQRN